MVVFLLNIFGDLIQELHFIYIFCLISKLSLDVENSLRTKGCDTVNVRDHALIDHRHIMNLMMILMPSSRTCSSHISYSCGTSQALRFEHRQIRIRMISDILLVSTYYRRYIMICTTELVRITSLQLIHSQQSLSWLQIVSKVEAKSEILLFYH